MELLTQDKINMHKKIARSETQHRNMLLSQEEQRLVLSVNTLKKEEAEARLKREQEEIERQKGLGHIKTVLDTQVAVLEERRKEALKPVDVERAEVQAIREENKKTEQALDDRENELDKNDYTLCQRELRAGERDIEFKRNEANLKIKSQKVQTDADNIVNKEIDIKRRQESLKNREDLSEQREIEVLQREHNASASEHANQVRSEQFIETEQKFIADDRALTDKYNTLQRAIIEANKKHNINIK